METGVDVLQDHVALALEQMPNLFEGTLAFIHVAEHDLTVESYTVIADERFPTLNHKPFGALSVTFNDARTGGSVFCRPSVQGVRFDLARTYWRGILFVAVREVSKLVVKCLVCPTILVAFSA